MRWLLLCLLVPALAQAQIGSGTIDGSQIAEFTQTGPGAANFASSLFSFSAIGGVATGFRVENLSIDFGAGTYTPNPAANLDTNPMDENFIGEVTDGTATSYSEFFNRFGASPDLSFDLLDSDGRKFSTAGPGDPYEPFRQNFNLRLGLDPAPVIQNAGWSGGKLGVDNTSDYLLTWEAFDSFYADGISLEILDSLNNIVLSSGYLDPSETSYLVPAGTLLAGEDYSAVLSFTENPSFFYAPSALEVPYLSLETASGSDEFEIYGPPLLDFTFLGGGISEASTSFTIAAIPEPSAIGLALLSLGGLSLLRRRRH